MSDGDEPRSAPWQMTEDEWEAVYSRPRGIFTDVDRKFLWGVKQYDSSPTRSERRAEIRKRAENALLDLFYLPEMDDDQRARVFEEVEQVGEDGPWGLHESVSHLIQVLYHGVDGDTKWLEEAVKRGIWKAQGDVAAKEDVTRYRPGSGLYAGVEVDITIDEGYNVDDLEERAQAGGVHSLTDTEIGILVREGRLDLEDRDDLPTPHDNPAFRGPPAAADVSDSPPPEGFADPESERSDAEE